MLRRHVTSLILFHNSQSLCRTFQLAQSSSCLQLHAVNVSIDILQNRILIDCLKLAPPVIVCECTELLSVLIFVCAGSGCSAARALARKLAEEKQAAVNAAKQAAEQSMDEEELEAIKLSVEQASAEAAREAARADALARAARTVGPSGASQLFDLERLRVSVLRHLHMVN